MHRSRVLTLIGTNAPCLACHVATAEAARAGCADLAFLIPQLADAVWTADALSDAERAVLNNELANLVRGLQESATERAVLADSAGKTVLHIAGKDTRLAELVADFLTAFAEAGHSEVPPAQEPTAGA